MNKCLFWPGSPLTLSLSPFFFPFAYPSLLPFPFAAPFLLSFTFPFSAPSFLSFPLRRPLTPILSPLPPRLPLSPSPPHSPHFPYRQVKLNLANLNFDASYLPPTRALSSTSATITCYYPPPSRKSTKGR